MNENIRRLEIANQQLGRQVSDLEVELDLMKDENNELTNQRDSSNKQLEIRQAKTERIQDLENQVTTLANEKVELTNKKDELKELIEGINLKELILTKLI